LTVLSTFVTITKNWWETDTWPIFAQMCCSHDATTIHTEQMFVTYASRGNLDSQNSSTSRLLTVCYKARVICSTLSLFHKRAGGLRLETIIHLSYAQSISILLLPYQTVKAWNAVYLDVPKQTQSTLMFPNKQTCLIVYHFSQRTFINCYLITQNCHVITFIRRPKTF
jgi:hypothetical protein